MSEVGTPAAAPAPSEAPAPAAAPESAPAPVERARESSSRPSIDRAFAKVYDATPPAPIETTTAEKPAAPAAPAVAGERARGPDGKFLPATGAEPGKAAVAAPVTPAPDTAKSLYPEPPTRFVSDREKYHDTTTNISALWKDTPEPVRVQIHRTIGELEKGIQKYRDDATAFEPLKPYHDLAKQHGTSIKDTMEQYIRLSQGLQSANPMPAIEELLRHAKMTPQMLAEKVLGQKPEEHTARASQEIMELRNTVTQLQRQLQTELGEVKVQFQSQHEQAVTAQVAKFAQDHPRFDELSEEIAIQIKSGYELEKAYERAEKLNPLPPAPAPVASNATPDPQAQTLKGSLSVTGAPAAGSNPQNRGPSPSTKAALDKAFASVGLG